MYASWMDVFFLTNTLSDLSLVSSVALLSALVSSLLSYKNKVETKTWKRFIFARKCCSLKITQWRPSKKQCIFLTKGPPSHFYIVQTNTQKVGYFFLFLVMNRDLLCGTFLYGCLVVFLIWCVCLLCLLGVTAFWFLLVGHVFLIILTWIKRLTTFFL